MDKKYKKGFYMEMKTFENDSKEKKLEKDFNEIVEKMIVFYAMNYAVDNNGISISDILNKFKTNYIFAEKIIKKLEEMQIIEKNEGIQKKKCLIFKEEWKDKRILFQNDLKLNDEKYKEYINKKLKYKKLEDTEDSLLIDAIEFALETGEVKNSSIRNKFAVSYARAGRIINQLEERDIIYKTGEVLITKKEWEENKKICFG